MLCVISNQQTFTVVLNDVMRIYIEMEIIFFTKLENQVNLVDWNQGCMCMCVANFVTQQKHKTGIRNTWFATVGIYHITTVIFVGV